MEPQEAVKAFAGIVCAHGRQTCRRALDALVRFYAKAPLAWDVKLKISAGEAPAAMVGNAVGGRLGWDSSLGSPG